MLIEFNDLILNFGSFINSIVSYPSNFVPLISPNLVLVVISSLLGYAMGKKSNFPQTMWILIFSIMIFSTLKFIGVGG